jgi:hypothetical protein
VSEPGQPDAGGQLAPHDTGTTTGKSLSFSIVFKGTTYDISVEAPNASGLYGFTITSADGTASAITVAELIYKDEDNWTIKASLPKSLQLDTNLTLNALSIDLTEGNPGTAS